MISDEINGAEGDFTASFEPTWTFSLIFFIWEDWDQHTLTEKRSLLDHVNQCKPFNTSALILDAKEEPIIITVGVDIIFDQKVELIFLLNAYKGFAQISRLKVGVYFILFWLLMQNSLLLKLFKIFPIIIDQRVNTF